jgi:hypothetical protein
VYPENYTQEFISIKIKGSRKNYVKFKGRETKFDARLLTSLISALSLCYEQRPRRSSNPQESPKKNAVRMLKFDQLISAGLPPRSPWRCSSTPPAPAPVRGRCPSPLCAISTRAISSTATTLPVPAQCDLDQGNLEHGRRRVPEPGDLDVQVRVAVPRILMTTLDGFRSPW